MERSQYSTIGFTFFINYTIIVIVGLEICDFKIVIFLIDDTFEWLNTYFSNIIIVKPTLFFQFILKSHNYIT